jgi:hypothetical protein
MDGIEDVADFSSRWYLWKRQYRDFATTHAGTVGDTSHDGLAGQLFGRVGCVLVATMDGGSRVGYGVDGV